jgi:hypothetical protein
MFFPQGIEEVEEERVNIKIIIGIHNNHGIIKEMHPPKEEVEEVQVIS